MLSAARSVGERVELWYESDQFLGFNLPPVTTSRSPIGRLKQMCEVDEVVVGDLID